MASRTSRQEYVQAVANLVSVKNLYLVNSAVYNIQDDHPFVGLQINVLMRRTIAARGLWFGVNACAKIVAAPASIGDLES